MTCRRVSTGPASVLAILLLAAAPADACGLELVLAIDVSRSVVESEFEIQTGGLAAAFRDSRVVAAITWTEGGIMATVTQWSGAASQEQTVPWSHLTDAASIAAFASAVELQERAFSASYTAIGAALVHADSLGATNPRPCARRVIDVSGDGTSNHGPEPKPVAETLAARGVTVNGLVILGAWPDPAAYYRDNVVRGDGAFLELAQGFGDYPAAIRRKLLRELAPQLAER